MSLTTNLMMAMAATGTQMKARRKNEQYSKRPVQSKLSSSQKMHREGHPASTKLGKMLFHADCNFNIEGREKMMAVDRLLRLCSILLRAFWWIQRIMER